MGLKKSRYEVPNGPPKDAFASMFVISSVNYVAISANEMTIVDDQQWINIHVYMMKNWKRVPILLTFEKVEMGVTLNNIEAIILNAMGRYGGLTNEAMASKWVYLGCDGDFVFQGIWIGVITQTWE